MIFIRYIQGGRKQQISNRAGNRDYPFAICGKFAFDNVLFIKSFPYHLLRFAPVRNCKFKSPGSQQAQRTVSPESHHIRNAVHRNSGQLFPVRLSTIQRE